MKQYIVRPRISLETLGFEKASRFLENSEFLGKHWVSGKTSEAEKTPCLQCLREHGRSL